MSAFFAHPHHMPCDECGASIAAGDRDAHVCDAERRLDFRMFQLRGEVAGLEPAIRRYLTSPHGRFALWCAERERPA